MNEYDTVSPWFAVFGNLMIACWDKLGRDLDFAWSQGTLKGGVHLVWRLIKGCLEDQKCSKAVENGQAALEMLQEERSERANSEKGEKQKAKLYPDLKDLESLEATDSDEEIQALTE